MKLTETFLGFHSLAGPFFATDTRIHGWSCWLWDGMVCRGCGRIAAASGGLLSRPSHALETPHVVEAFLDIGPMMPNRSSAAAAQCLSVCSCPGLRIEPPADMGWRVRGGSAVVLCCWLGGGCLSGCTEDEMNRNAGQSQSLLRFLSWIVCRGCRLRSGWLRPVSARPLGAVAGDGLDPRGRGPPHGSALHGCACCVVLCGAPEHPTWLLLLARPVRLECIYTGAGGDNGTGKI
jgi:hypothetical protein